MSDYVIQNCKRLRTACRNTDYAIKSWNPSTSVAG